MKTKKGFYWHVHHDKLCEWCYDYQERMNCIKKDKPKNEIETRLRLFKPVKHPEKLSKECREMIKKYDEALKKSDEVLKKCDKALREYDEALKKSHEVLKKYAPKIEKLHKEECGCSEWNGEELAFKELKK